MHTQTEYPVYLRNSRRHKWRLNVLTLDRQNAEDTARALVAQAKERGYAETQGAVLVNGREHKGDIGDDFRPTRKLPGLARVFG